jgi:hypothetical protein
VAALASTRLPFDFDVVKLTRDVERALSVTTWEEHFNAGYRDGEWSGIALRTNSASILTLFIDPARPDAFCDTEALASCDYVPSLLESFACSLGAVRFLKLAPGASILEHRDVDVCIEKGALRIHVPITTNPDVDFYVGGKRMTMRPGECWYLNLDQPHSVTNRGATDRIHLVIDAVANEWARALVADANQGS